MSNFSLDYCIDEFMIYCRSRDLRRRTLDSYEHGIMIRALNELRNDMLEEQRDPGPVEDVLLKTIDAPSQKDRKAKRRDEAR